MIWDSFSIRSVNLKFTNGKGKKVGKTYPRARGNTQMFEAKFKFQPGEVLDGTLLLGEGYSYMNELAMVKNLQNHKHD